VIFRVSTLFEMDEARQGIKIRKSDATAAKQRPGKPSHEMQRGWGRENGVQSVFDLS
jgi:hypothetical protein